MAKDDGSGQVSGESRRSFLRKAAYSTPTLMMLGTLNPPAQAQRDGECDPFVDPNCNGESGPIPGASPARRPRP